MVNNAHAREIRTFLGYKKPIRTGEKETVELSKRIWECGAGQEDKFSKEWRGLASLRRDRSPAGSPGPFPAEEAGAEALRKAQVGHRRYRQKRGSGAVEWEGKEEEVSLERQSWLLRK